MRKKTMIDGERVLRRLQYQNRKAQKALRVQGWWPRVAGEVDGYNTAIRIIREEMEKEQAR